MTLWAIKFIYAEPRKNWIDHRTVAMTRREAWKNHNENNAGIKPRHQVRLKRLRGAGLIRAVKVEVVEVANNKKGGEQ